MNNQSVYWSDQWNSDEGYSKQWVAPVYQSSTSAQSTCSFCTHSTYALQMICPLTGRTWSSRNYPKEAMSIPKPVKRVCMCCRGVGLLQFFLATCPRVYRCFARGIPLISRMWVAVFADLILKPKQSNLSKTKLLHGKNSAEVVSMEKYECGPNFSRSDSNLNMTVLTGKWNYQRAVSSYSNTRYFT